MHPRKRNSCWLECCSQNTGILQDNDYWKITFQHYAPVIWNPHSGLSWAFTFYASESEWSPWLLGTKVNGAFPRPYFSTHGTPFVKQLIIARVTHWLKSTGGSHDINRLIFEWPANNQVRDAKTVTLSEFPFYEGTKMKCKWGERPKWGGAGVSNDWCIISLQ